MTRTISAILTMFAVVFATVTMSLADDGSGTAPERQDPATILKVDYSDGSGRQAVGLTMQDLKELPAAGFKTTTIWTEGKQRFDGVWLKDLAAHLGFDKGRIELTALNEYMMEMDVADIGTSEALIAYARNGEAMPAREKGPLWMVFPYDRDSKFRTEAAFALSIWQLDRITLLHVE